MTPLALTLPLSPYETPTAYMSRLARRNLGGPLRQFSEDVGIDLAALARGDALAVRQLQQLASLPADSFTYTTIKILESKKLFAGPQPLHREGFMSPDMSVCPVCLQEDRAEHEPGWHAVHRLHWQLSHVTLSSVGWQQRQGSTCSPEAPRILSRFWMSAALPILPWRETSHTHSSESFRSFWPALEGGRVLISSQ